MKIILDTDIGNDIDDALALGLVLASPEIELLGVTTVFRDVEQRARLAYFLLSEFKRDQVPVYTGSGIPLVEEEGQDAIFQAHIVPKEFKEVYRTGAVQFISQMAEKYNGEIELVAIGPLTNIALALRLDPSLTSRLRGITIMGGQVYEPGSEYNILCDPEAAHIVFSSGIPIKMVGLDVTMRCQLTDSELKELKQNKILGKLVDLWQKITEANPVLHDPLAVASLLASNIIQWEEATVAVELGGKFLRGQTLIKKGKGTQVAKEVRRNEFMQLFLERINTLN